MAERLTEIKDRIWSEPLTDNERHLALTAFTWEPGQAAQWGSFVLKVLDAREQVVRDLEAQVLAEREAGWGEAYDAEALHQRVRDLEAALRAAAGQRCQTGWGDGELTNSPACRCASCIARAALAAAEEGDEA